MFSFTVADEPAADQIILVIVMAPAKLPAHWSPAWRWLRFFPQT